MRILLIFFQTLLRGVKLGYYHLSNWWTVKESNLSLVNSMHYHYANCPYTHLIVWQVKPPILDLMERRIHYGGAYPVRTDDNRVKVCGVAYYTNALYKHSFNLSCTLHFPTCSVYCMWQRANSHYVRLLVSGLEPRCNKLFTMCKVMTMQQLHPHDKSPRYRGSFHNLAYKDIFIIIFISLLNAYFQVITNNNRGYQYLMTLRLLFTGRPFFTTL